MIDTTQLFQAGASLIERSFRETLNPKRPGQHRPGIRVVIRNVMDHAMAIPRRHRSSKNAFELLLGLAGSAAHEECDAFAPPGVTEDCRVVNTLSNLIEPFCYNPRRTVFSAKNIHVPQSQ